jgi:hypothetical protein
VLIDLPLHKLVMVPRIPLQWEMSPLLYHRLALKQVARRTIPLLEVLHLLMALRLELLLALQQHMPTHLLRLLVVFLPKANLQPEVI